MEYEKTILVEILSEINKFNESVAENFKGHDSIILSLGYCFNKDTLHSFYDKLKCYNCSGFESENIKISGWELEPFKKHFEKGFAPKLIDLIDTWPKKNNFPYIHNLGINSLPEHENLLELYSFWEEFTEEDKFDQLFDTDAIQKEYHKTPEKSDELSELLG